MSESDPVWLKVGKLVCEFFKCPIVLISSIEPDRVVMLCRFGLTSSSSRFPTVTSHKIFPTSKELLLLPDISADPRFTTGQQRVFFVEQEDVRFYLCIPLFAAGKKFGNLFLMDRVVRNDFDSEKKMFLNEVSIMLGTLLSDERCGLASSLMSPLEKISLLSETRTIENRVLSVIKLPLRNCVLLQKSFQEFHLFLVQQQKNKSGANGNITKSEYFHRIIDERRQLVLNSIELGRLSMKEYASLSSYYNRAGNAQTGRMRRQSGPMQTGNFLSVKEWMNNIHTYVKTNIAPNANSNPNSQTKIEWLYEESHYVEIEDDDRYEIIGKIIELSLLSSFHRWNSVLVNISVSDEQDDARIDALGPLNNRENPYSDASHHSTKERTNGFLNERTGRIHIDITTRSKEHQISRLVDEQQFYTTCDEYATDLLTLLHGQTAKISRTVGILNGEKKAISIPCNIREKKIKTKNSVSSETTTDLYNGKHEKKMPHPQNRFSLQFNDDIAQLHDLLEIYDTSNRTSNQTSNELSRDDDDDNDDNNDDDKTYSRQCDDDDVNQKRFKKDVSMLGEFQSKMVRVKKNKVFPSSASLSSTSTKLSTNFGNGQTMINDRFRSHLVVDDYSEKDSQKFQSYVPLSDAKTNNTTSTIDKLKKVFQGYSFFPSTVAAGAGASSTNPKSSKSFKSSKKQNPNQNNPGHGLFSFFSNPFHGNKKDISSKEISSKVRLKPVRAPDVNSAAAAAAATPLPGNQQTSTYLSFFSHLYAQFHLSAASPSPVRILPVRPKKNFVYRKRKVISVQQRR